jgi:hypothetical protein
MGRRKRQALQNLCRKLHETVSQRLLNEMMMVVGEERERCALATIVTVFELRL